MAAVKGLLTSIGEAVETLSELTAFEVKFVLAFDPATGHHWYLVNPWGPEDPEDWPFHALRQGCETTLEAAIEALAAATVRALPESGFSRKRKAL